MMMLPVGTGPGAVEPDPDAAPPGTVSIYKEAADAVNGMIQAVTRTSAPANLYIGMDMVRIGLFLSPIIEHYREIDCVYLAVMIDIHLRIAERRLGMPIVQKD